MADKKPSPVIVGRQFIKKYYERLDKTPETVFRFYQENSTLIYGEGTAPEESVVGIEAIKEKLAARCGQGYLLSLEHGTVDAQQSMDGGVLLMVTGTITRKGSNTPSQFVQSFFLAEQAASPNASSASYYVLNDTFRVIDASGAAPAASSTAAAAAAAAAPPAAAPKPAAAPPKAKPAAPKPAASEAPPKPSEVAPPTTGAAAAAAVPPAKAAAPPAPAPAAAPVAAAAAPPAPAPEAPKPAAPSPKPSSWAAMAAASAQKAPAASAFAPPRAAAAPRAVAAAPAPAAAAPPASTPAPAAAAAASAAPDAGAKAKNLSAQEMPSSAVFVKNIDTTTSENELKEAFLVFMPEPDKEKMLVANNVDRGYAFIDLGTQEAVARAVSASRGGGIKLKDKLLTVEPSKKPVRPSGLKAIAERKGVPGSGAKGSGGKGKAGKGGKGNKMVPAR